MSEREELTTIVHQSRAIKDTPDETAEIILATGYARVSADPDTVERVAEAIHAESCGCNAQSGALVGEWHQLARAAINAIGGGGNG